MSDFFEREGQSPFPAGPRPPEQRAWFDQPEINSDYAQKFYERQQNLERYRVDLSNDEFAVLNQLFPNERNEEEYSENRYRVATAMQLARMYDISIEDAYANVDSILEATYDRKMLYKDSFKAVSDSFALGTNQVKMAVLGNRLLLATDIDERNKLWKEIEEIGRDNETLADGVTRNMFLEGLKGLGNSWGFTATSAGAGFLGGLINPALGVVSAAAVSSAQMIGLEYISLLSQGIDDETARSTAIASGIFQGVVEAVFGDVAALGAGTGLGQIIFRQLHYSGAIGAAARIIGGRVVDILMEGAGESVQEMGSQSFAEAARQKTEEKVRDIIARDDIFDKRERAAEDLATEAYRIYYEKTSREDGFGNMLPRPTTEEQDQAVKESFRVATLTSLITGVPIIGRDVYVTRRDIRQLGAAQKVASNIDEFKELTKDNEAFKGMTDENKSKIQEEIFNAGAAQREAEAERVREESAPPPPGARPLVEYPAASRRQEGGRLSVRLPEGALNEDFTETHRMTIHDPEDDQLYGRLDFRRGENGDIQIDGIQVRSYITDRDQVIMDAVKELGVNFPGARIDWDPENTGDRILRDRLLNGRPPGLDLGLNWFDGKKDYEAVESQAEQQGWIADVAPQIPAEQRQTAYEVAGFLYRSRGESAEDWGRRVEFTNTVPEGMREGFTAAQGGEGRVKGATFDWAEVAGKTKRYIYLSEKADFSTLNHELIHDHIKALSNEQRGEWEAAIGLTDGDWNAGRYEGRNGKAVNAHEYVAEAFEDYLTQKKEPPSSGLKALFDRIIGFMRNIYGALRDNNKINPELKRKFDEIFAEEASGTGREAEANPYEYEAEFDRKLERLNEDSRKRAREMLGGEAREQQARDEVIADPEAAMDNAERIEKLKNSPDIVLDDKAYQGKYEIDKSPKENNRSITSYLKNFMKKERLENPYIADPIRLGNKGIAKITSYGMSNPVYMKSIAHIPAMLKNAILIEESNKNRPTAHYQGFKHLISGIEIDGEKYTAHIILGENAGIWYYQHNLSKIEKGALIEVIQATNSGLQGSLSEIKDTTLIGILQDPKKTKLQGESFDSADPSIQFQIIGEQGAAALDRAEEITARLDNLNIARQMEAAEKDAKTVRLATGWERGADGKWRYEIPDLKIKPEISEDIDNRDNPEGYGFVIGEGGKLGDFVDADALFTAYPQLKDVSVFYDEGLDANAGYNPKEKTIRLGNNIDQGSEEFRSLLIHETQHAVQEIEGFARGGNANQFTRQNNKQSILDGIDKARQKAFNEIPENLKEAARTVNRGEDADGLALAHIQADPEAKAAWADYIRALADAAEIAGIPNEQFDGLSPEEQYQRLAGETEARNAVARMGFTPEQRLETLLEETEDVSREDQIFLAASALFQPASDTEILFQLADEEITRAVFQFPSWEAWKFNDESLGFFGLDTALPGGLTGAEAEAWYKATWERKRAEAAAQEKTADPLTSSQIDGRLLEKWRSEKGLTEWLKALQQARQEDSYSGTAMDEDGGRAREEQAVLRNRIEHEVHPAVKMAAQRVFRGRSLTDTQRKTVMTLLERGIPYYRNLYVNITGDSEFSGYAGNEIRENRYAEAAGEENLSVFQKQQLAKKLENEEIRRKYKNGTLTEDETRTYIETLKREKREAEAKLKKAEAELLEDEKRLSDDDRELYRRQQELDRNESTLTGYEEEIVRLEEALAKEQARGRREKAESRREIEKANLAGRMHQGRYGAARLRAEVEKLTEKARELRADIARRRKALTQQKKEGRAGISRAKAIAALE
ncbi:MAG: hypothetical protein LBJ90_03655, partial [Treponema sp.]|nr:hypothetical protein [Treponema sp.]